MYAIFMVDNLVDNFFNTYVSSRDEKELFLESYISYYQFPMKHKQCDKH